MQDLTKLISDLHEHSKHVVQERARAEALFVNIGDGAIVTDENGKISRINQSALNLLGYKEKDVLGKWFPSVIIATDEKGKPTPPIERAITKAFLTGKTVYDKTFYKSAHRGLFPVQCTISPIMLEDKPIGAIEVFRDISAEYELARLQDEFISIASHQLRTPATAVKNFIGLLREGFAGDLTEEQAGLIEQAYISNEHQLDIINNLLYVARADSNQVTLKLTETNLAELVQNCIKEQQQVIKTRNQTLSVSSPNNLRLTLDRQFIHMLIENLLTNASKYTPDGGKISVKLQDDGRDAILTVEDKGVGIAHEDQSRLFQRFIRIENELSTSRGGSGIGLYLAKRIVELHHGKIKLKSSPGRGTTFAVTLPKEAQHG